MRQRILAAITVVCFIVLFGCTPVKNDSGPKIEVKSYSEKLVKVQQPLILELHSECGNIEVYSWEKHDIKFEMTKKLRGTQKKDILEKKLHDYPVEILENANKISFNSQYKGFGKKSSEQSMDLKVFVPKRIHLMNFTVSEGNIKFYDDVRCGLTITADTANIDINSLEGKIALKSSKGNIRIGGGSIFSGSSVRVDSGNIAAKAAYEENGSFSYETRIGNIDIGIPSGSKVSVGTMGTLEVNEFSDLAYGTKLTAASRLGKISVKKY